MIGVARFIESLEQSSQFSRDEILLTRYTDPSWTMLMALAKVNSTLAHDTCIT